MSGEFQGFYLEPLLFDTFDILYEATICATNNVERHFTTKFKQCFIQCVRTVRNKFDETVLIYEKNRRRGQLYF
jgi:hypothetical protein